MLVGLFGWQFSQQFQLALPTREEGVTSSLEMMSIENVRQGKQLQAASCYRLNF
jgi:hypothetical protein